MKGDSVKVALSSISYRDQHGLYFHRTKNPLRMSLCSSSFLARRHLFVKLLSSQFHSRSLHSSVIDRFNNISWRECGSMMTNIIDRGIVIKDKLSFLWHSVSHKLLLGDRARSVDKENEILLKYHYEDLWVVGIASCADDQDESQQKLFANNQKYFANKTKSIVSTLSPTSSSLLEISSSKEIINDNKNKVSWFSTAPTESEWVTALGHKRGRGEREGEGVEVQKTNQRWARPQNCSGHPSTVRSGNLREIYTTDFAAWFLAHSPQLTDFSRPL